MQLVKFETRVTKLLIIKRLRKNVVKKSTALMTHQLSRFFVFACALVLFSNIVYASQSTDAEKTSARQLITAAVVKNFPPHYSLSESNEPQGFAIDILEEIARSAGMEITYIVFDDWTQTGQALKDGKADLIPNLGISQSRQVNFDFSRPVETFPISIIVRSDTFRVRSANDLPGKVVGVVKFNVGEKIVSNLGNIKAIAYEQPESALLALLAGHVDALVYPKSVMLKIAREVGLENRIKITGDPLKEIKRAVAVRKGNTNLLSTLNTAIEELTLTKQYSDIYAKWYGTPEPFWSVTRILYAAGTLIILTIILSVLWRNSTLTGINKRLTKNIEVRKQTEIALQESEKKLIKAQEISKIGNWELNLITNQLDWSDQIYRMFGINPDEFQPTLETFLDVIHPDDRERVNTAYTGSLTKRLPYSIDHRIRMPDGTIKHVKERCETFYDKDGKPIRSTGTVQDITEQVNMEEILRHTQKMDALGKLTGGIAHDYNNMLGVVIGFSELLEGALSEQPKLAKYAHEIHHAAKRGAKLTKKLLSFSRKKSINADVLNINSLLQDERHMLEKTLTARIQLKLELDNDLWPVKLDIGDLEDAIINLSINTMHAIDGNGELCLHTSNEVINEIDAKLLKLEPGNYVLLNIIDTGIGMDESIRERIFDPFFSTKGNKGTGLGLSQVYGFVERSNGAIKVYSEPGQGTHFTLYFPRYYENDISEHVIETSPEKDSIGKETILVVDDEQALLGLSFEILNQSGYSVICAQSAKQALSILETEPIDLLISDVIMPEMDGYQLAKLVQKKYPHVKIQLSSGFSESKHHGTADEILRQNLLDKPFNSKALLQRVRTLLDS